MSQHKPEEKKPAPAQTGLAPVKSETKLATAQSVPRGMELMRTQDLKLPQMHLVQGLSKQVAKGIAIPGDIVDTVLDEVLNGSAKARKPTIFIPAAYFLRRVKWVPMASGGGIDCRSNDAVHGDVYGACSQCQHSAWRPKVKGDQQKGIKEDTGAPLCTLYHCFLGHIEGREIPIILDLSKSKEKVASRLLSLMAFSKSPNLWDKKWAFTTKEEPAPGGTMFFNYEHQVLPEAPSDKDKAYSEMLFNIYASKTSKLDMELQKEEFAAQAASEKDMSSGI